MTRSRMWRWIAWRVLAFLVVGAVVNGGVTLLCATQSPVPFEECEPVAGWPTRVPSDWPQEPRARFREVSLGKAFQMAKVGPFPFDEIGRVDPNRPQRPYFCVYWTTCGFPFRWMSIGQMDTCPAGDPEVHTVRFGLLRSDCTDSAVNLWVIEHAALWFAANTAAYAALFAVPLAAVRAVRWRLRRGRLADPAAR